MPVGVMQYNIGISNNPYNIEDSFIYRDDEVGDDNERFVFNYKDYNINTIRHSAVELISGRPYHHSRVCISKDGYELMNIHDDGDCTSLWFEQYSYKNPIHVEDKLVLKAMNIIDHLDENGKATLDICNRGNIVNYE